MEPHVMHDLACAYGRQHSLRMTRVRAAPLLVGADSLVPAHEIGSARLCPPRGRHDCPPLLDAARPGRARAADASGHAAAARRAIPPQQSSARGVAESPLQSLDASNRGRGARIPRRGQSAGTPARRPGCWGRFELLRQTERCRRFRYGASATGHVTSGESETTTTAHPRRFARRGY